MTCLRLLLVWRLVGQVIEVNKEAVAKHDSAMQELRANLIRVKAAAASTKAEQEDTIKATEAKLPTTSIELVSFVLIRFVQGSPSALREVVDLNSTVGCVAS